jgi:hypothetical protein
MQHEIPLTRPKVSVGAAIGLVLLALVAGYPMGVMAIVYSFTEAETPRAFVAMSVIGWGVVGGLTFVLRDTFRRMTSKPVLRVGPNSLAVEDRTALRGTVEIPRDQVRAASLELNPHAACGNAFPLVGANPHQPDGWLWLAGFDSPLPLAGTGDQPPNVALVFNWPLTGRRGKRIPALLMRAQDPHAAADALTPLGIVRQLTPADGEFLLAGLRGA